MDNGRPKLLDPPVDLGRDHVLGPAHAELTLVEYGSYTCPRCHAVHGIIEDLRRRFGERMRYVFRHLPVPDDPDAQRSAWLAEYASLTTGDFWATHAALMEQGPRFSPGELDRLMLGIRSDTSSELNHEAFERARARVAEDAESAARGGAQVTPAFFINGTRYVGPWDETSLAEAMLGSLGHRVQAAALDFVRWGPASGVLLLLATILALYLSNSDWGEGFLGFWATSAGINWGGSGITLSVLDWVNHGLLTVFFFVVGLEIKREFTVGHLATLRSGALPVLAAFGGLALPALIYAAVAPPGLKHGWGVPIGTDTAFAVALIVLMGSRVPVELRVFLTAAVIIDDIVAILIIALFYTGAINLDYIYWAAGVSLLLVVLNRIGMFIRLPYAVGGVVLWFLLHAAGLHATLAGVILALVIPTRPPANLRALLAQASGVMREEEARFGEAMRSGPSAQALRTLDIIHDRLEPPADRILHAVEPWSSYFVLPLFALANAGVVFSRGVFDGHWRLTFAIVLGLVIGKPVGMVLAARLATGSGVAEKPDAYSWNQLSGAAALGGIGFTMSLFISSAAFPDRTDFAAAKIAIFSASLLAGLIGSVLLWRSGRPELQVGETE